MLLKYWITAFIIDCDCFPYSPHSPLELFRWASLVSITAEVDDPVLMVMVAGGCSLGR